MMPSSKPVHAGAQNVTPQKVNLRWNRLWHVDSFMWFCKHVFRHNRFSRKWCRRQNRFTRAPKMSRLRKLIFVETGYDVSTLLCGFVNTSLDITGFLVNDAIVTTGSRGRPKCPPQNRFSRETPIFNLCASFIKGHSRQNRLWRVMFLSLDTTGSRNGLGAQNVS